MMAGGFDLNNKNIAIGVVALVVIVAVAGVVYWMMNDGDQADATYTVSLSYDSETGTATGEGVYDAGEKVTVTATPANGYGFKGWFVGTEMVSEDERYTFTADSDVVLTPSFRILYTVSIDYDSEFGTVTGAGKYMEGDTCTLTAIPKSGCSFAGWFTETGYQFASDESWSFEVRGDRYYYADMGKDGLNVSVVYDPSEGTVTPSTVGIVDYGTRVTLYAEPNIGDGYSFDRWLVNGEVSDSVFEITQIITEDTVFEVEFSLKSYDVSLWYDSTMGSIHGVDENASYTHGTTLHLQAIPATGYSFDHWEINGEIFTSSELSYIITKPLTIRVIFVMN